jgi:hypothetical protein
VQQPVRRCSTRAYARAVAATKLSLKTGVTPAQALAALRPLLVEATSVTTGAAGPSAVIYGIARTALENTGPVVVSIKGAVASIAVTSSLPT